MCAAAHSDIDWVRPRARSTARCGCDLHYFVLSSLFGVRYDFILSSIRVATHRSCALHQSVRRRTDLCGAAQILCSIRVAIPIVLFHSATFGFSFFETLLGNAPSTMGGKRTRSAAAVERRTARRVAVSLETMLWSASGHQDTRNLAVSMPLTQQQVHLSSNGGVAWEGSRQTLAVRRRRRVV